MIYKLKDLIKIKYGKNQKKVECEAGCYHIIGTGGIIGKAKEYLYDKPSVLIGRKGTIDKVRYIDEPFWTIDTLFYTEINEKIVLPKYLYYKLSMINFKNYNEGTTIPSLKTETLYEIEIDIDDMTMQKKIVKILSKLEDKIRLNNQINDNLYNQAVAIYNESFKEINQREYSIGDYIVPKRGKNLLSRDAILGDVPVVAGGIEPATYHNMSNTKAPVITISASGANAGYINLWNIPVWSSDSSYIDNTITNSIYFWYLTLKNRQKEIFDTQTGSAQPHIYPKHIAELSITKLNESEILKYEKKVTPFFNMIGKNKNENKYLEQLRDTLLPKLMNGEINLDKIEI